MKLVARTKNKITKYENRENVPRLEITYVVLVHRNIAKKDYQHDSKFLCTFAPNKSFGELLDISFYFQKPLFQNYHILKYSLLIKFLNC